MLQIVRFFSTRYADAPGDPHTVVVVLVVIEAVLVLPGVIVLDELSTHEAWQSIADPVVPVMTRITSEVLASIIILVTVNYRVSRSASPASAPQSWVLPNTSATSASTSTPPVSASLTSSRGCYRRATTSSSVSAA